MDRREQLSVKLEHLYLYFRSSMVSNFEAEELQRQGVDSRQFSLVEETTWGSMYFRPMSQERLDALDKRPDFDTIPFDEDDSYPNEDDAYMVRDAINEQLLCSKYRAETEEDLWSAYEFTSWEPVGLVYRQK